jgi:hypothetical protein
MARRCEVREAVDAELQRHRATAWAWTLTGGGHQRLTVTDAAGGRHLVHLASTPSDRRTVINSVALVRRLLRKGELA